MLGAMTARGDADQPGVRIAHVLVPLDGSDFAAAAMPTAQALAARLGAVVEVVSVAARSEDLDELRASAIRALGGGRDADERARLVAEDDPAHAIERRAAELAPALVCLSTHGRGRVAGAVLGSVAASVLQRTTTPVVAVGRSVDRAAWSTSPAPAPLSVPRLVACVDGGEASERVIPVAAAWAAALGMSLTVLTVAEPTPPPLRDEGAWHRHHGPEEAVDRYLARLRDRWAATVPDLETEAVYDPIGPGDGLRAHLLDRPAGLVAVTTHARTGLQRALLGSGAAAIVHAATAPVLVVPLGA
jgi:nucleotide-binding universal stress UspA family protein